MGLSDLFKKSESLIAVDIGLSGVKLMELDQSGEKPRLANIGFSPFQENVFNNNVISKPEKVAELIGDLLESNAIKGKRVITAVPGPSVFTKKIKMAKAPPVELRSNLQFEAGNFIPHGIEAVSLDYHIIGVSQKNDLDVLAVAVKNEVIDSYIDCLSLAGLEVAIVDVDYFAIQNMVEMVKPDLVGKTVAIINIGARYSGFNICRGGESLFTGDMSIGGKLTSDALVEGLGVSFNDAEKIKKGKMQAKDAEGCKAILDKNIEYMASEYNRQLSFFWNASGADEGIDLIVLTGGAAWLAGFSDELSEKTGISVTKLDPLSGIECGESFDSVYLQEIGPAMSVATGLAIRKPGDRVVPDLD